MIWHYLSHWSLTEVFYVYLLSLEAGCTALATDWSCCDNKPGGCGENEGDCDNDSHCKAGLKCGTDNCPSGFPSIYDCCYNASGSGMAYNASWIDLVSNVPM